MTRIFAKISLASIILLTLLHINFQLVYSQIPPRKNFNFIFEQNFEDDHPGDYQYSEYLNDWNSPTGNNRQSEVDILTDGDSHGKYMRGYYPMGKFGAENTGWSWDAPLPGLYTELYFSQDIRFKPGFKWVLGGKIPGVKGGKIFSQTQPSESDGFSVRMMWADEGKLVFYVYHLDRTTIYGDVYVWNNFKFVSGQWYNITFRLVLNSVTNNIGNKDGILEGFVDGKPVIQLKNFRFRNNENIKIDRVTDCSFFGGAEAAFSAQRDEWLDVDNIVAFQYAPDILNVPRGNQLSSFSKTLLHPYRDFLDTEWKNSFKINSVTSSQADFAWIDYPVSATYMLQRKKEGSQAFETIASLNYGTKVYSDKLVEPGTTYTYRIIANNSTSKEIIVRIPFPPVKAPSGLSTTRVDMESILLNWVDQSTNETSFELERSGPNDNNLKKSFTLNANATSFLDKDVKLNSVYQYRIRAYNQDGSSVFSNPLQVNSFHLDPPKAPSLLQSKECTEKSITIRWNDNSTNESGFIVKRINPLNSDVSATFAINPNDTSFVDDSLISNTTYVYTVQAINRAGNTMSNKHQASTLSMAETKRTKDGLIAYYNFGYSPYNTVRDLSGYGDPVDLNILQPNAVSWNESNRMLFNSSTALISSIPATKIVEAVKKTNEITIETWIRPEEMVSSLNSRILSIGNGNGDIGVVLDQYFEAGNDKSINFGSRLRTESTTEAGFPELKPDGTNSYITLQHIAYTKDSLGNETMYLNGSKVAEGFRPDNIGNWSNNFYLRLGNEEDQAHPWKGTFYIAAIYNKSLSNSEIAVNFQAGPCDNIESDDMNYDISIYPNPATDKTTIEIKPSGSLEAVSATHFNMQDINGRVYFTETIFNPNNDFTREIRLDNLAKGFYFIEVVSGHNHKTAKLIVQ